MAVTETCRQAAVAHTRDQAVPVAGLRVLGPFAQADDLLAQRAAGAGPGRQRPRRAVVAEGEERALVLVGIPATQLVLADVVAAPLGERDVDRPRKVWPQLLQQPRHVPAYDLGLERKGRGRDDDGLVRLEGVGDRGNQVGERLAGARPGLHQKVLAGFEGFAHLLRHLVLSGSVLSAHSLDGSIEKSKNVVDLSHGRRTAPVRPPGPRGP